MSPRSKRHRPLTRAEKPLRDARLIVIATEDTHAPRRYFELSYSKRTIDPQHFPPASIREAVTRAESLDQPPSDRWPQSTGTHVYKVVKRLL